MEHPASDSIVLIEDNPADVETVRRAIDQSDRDVFLEVVTGGTDAIRMVRESVSGAEIRIPDLILLDLNLPGVDGRELLQGFNQSRAFGEVPIVVLTTSNNDDDIRYSYRNGANAYVVKPGPFQEFVDRIQAICRFWLDSEPERES